MSQKVSRKAAVNEDKDKSKADSPVKEMKKKMAANAEKEKQAADKAEKSTEKAAEKSDKPEKSDKGTDKKSEKSDKSTDKKSEKSDKSTDKKSDKKDNVEKKNEKHEPQVEKSKAESSKEEKAGKSDKEKPEPKKVEQSKPKLNGKERAHNGVSDVTLGNGTGDALNGTVSADSEDDDVMLVIDDHDHDELFPELKYDDTSDMDCSEPPTPENVPSRSFTRRSQVKATRTPETPRPASDKQTDADEPKDSKLLKLKEDIPSTDRKLRSADSPKPQDKKQDADTKQDLENKDIDDKKDETQENEKTDKKDSQEKEAVNKEAGEKIAEDNKNSEDRVEVEIVVDLEANDGDEVQRKTDTNYSKSRVKVSPYRRSMRLADQTNTSVLANYTGNNTTMEMDITETSSSFIEEPNNLDDSSYLRGLRSIRGRSSYKPLKEMSLKHVINRSVRSTTSTNISSITESNRPTGTVVGRKRKPEVNESVELATEVTADVCTDSVPLAGGTKRMRVLERLAEPFRRVASVSLPSVSRRNADIVGINTDLPLSAPLVTDTFDPESIKSSVQQEPIAVPLPTPTREQHDNKRCNIM